MRLGAGRPQLKRDPLGRFHMMPQTASAAELAYHAGRIGLAGEGLLPSQQVALGNGSVVSVPEIIAAIDAAPKPVRITGEVRESVLRLYLSSVATDPDAAARFRIRTHNLGGDQPPIVEPDAPDDVTLLVIAFDQLLRVSKTDWRRFIRDHWIDGPVSWSADHPSSEWAQGFGLPTSILREVRAIVLLGYSVHNQMRSPFIPTAWEAA